MRPATLAIIETYAQVRSMVRDMEAMQTEKAGSPELGPYRGFARIGDALYMIEGLMRDSALEKPIDKIRYPNVAKKTRRLMMLATVEFAALTVALVIVDKAMPLDAGSHHVILASVFSLLAMMNIVAVYRAAKEDARCCNCNSPIPLESLQWHLIASGQLPVCKKCSAIIGAEYIKPMPDNSENPVNNYPENNLCDTAPQRENNFLKTSSAVRDEAKGEAK